MNAAGLARELLAYDAWATARILDAGADLDTTMPAEGASWGSIDSSLRHVAGAQATWLSRFTGKPPIEAGAADAGLRGWFSALTTATHAYLEGLSDAQLLGEVEFKDSRGNPHREVLALLLAHMVNHGTYHRGEAAMILTAAGHSPGDLDLLVYRRMMDPSR